MSSDLNGRARRGDAGYRAEWELVATPKPDGQREFKLGPNPYATPGQPDDGEKYAYYKNVVRYDGKVVTNRKAVVPDFVAATEDQLRTGNGLPSGFPTNQVEAGLRLFEADRLMQKVHEETPVWGANDRIVRAAREEYEELELQIQMAASDAQRRSERQRQPQMN